jgi:hypothetical protein
MQEAYVQGYYNSDNPDVGTQQCNDKRNDERNKCIGDH